MWCRTSPLSNQEEEWRQPCRYLCRRAGRSTSRGCTPASKDNGIRSAARADGSGRGMPATHCFRSLHGLSHRRSPTDGPRAASLACDLCRPRRHVAVRCTLRTLARLAPRRPPLRRPVVLRIRHRHLRPLATRRCTDRARVERRRARHGRGCVTSHVLDQALAHDNHRSSPLGTTA